MGREADWRRARDAEDAPPNRRGRASRGRQPIRRAEAGTRSRIVRGCGGVQDHGVCISTVWPTGRSKLPGPGKPATPSIEPEPVAGMQKVDAYTAETVPG